MCVCVCVCVCCVHVVCVVCVCMVCGVYEWACVCLFPQVHLSICDELVFTQKRRKCLKLSACSPPLPSPAEEAQPAAAGRTHAPTGQSLGSRAGVPPAAVPLQARANPGRNGRQEEAAVNSHVTHRSTAATRTNTECTYFFHPFLLNASTVCSHASLSPRTHCKHDFMNAHSFPHMCVDLITELSFVFNYCCTLFQLSL